MSKKKVLNMLDLLLIGCLMLFIYLFCVNLTGVYNSKDIEQILENNTINLNPKLVLENTLQFEIDGRFYPYDYDKDLLEVSINYEQDKIVQVNVHTNNDEQVLGEKQIKLNHGETEYLYEIGFPAKTYKLVIKSLFDDLSINNIYINNKIIKVSEFHYSYTTLLDSSEREINISADHHETSELVIKRINSSSTELKDGLNEFIIFIISEFGNRSKPYTLNIYKEIKLIEWSSDAHLTSLKIEGYDLSPVFIPNQYEYQVKVKQDNIELDFIKGHFGQSVEVIGDINNLNEGENEIIVKVVSQNFLITNEYTILVNKVASKNFLMLTSISFLVIIITLGSLGLVYYLKKRNR